MKKLYQLLLDRWNQKTDTVLVTIVEGNGSVPRTTGAYMVVAKNGRIYGTIGGGNLEYQAVKKAMELAGIRFDKKGIKTDENLETNMEEVYAIGDVNGRIQLAHAASAQGIQVIDRILKRPKGRESVIPSVIFTSPEIGSAGKSEEQCREEDIKVKVSVFPFTANGKAKIQGESEGFVKLIMEEQSRRIIGGVVVGPDASALISCIAVAITNNLTDDGLSGTVFAHPTTSEAVWEAAMGLSTGCIHYHE